MYVRMFLFRILPLLVIPDTLTVDLELLLTHFATHILVQGAAINRCFFCV